MKILNGYIVPVIRTTEKAEGLRFETLHGIAFFINERGFFLTASHVIQAATNDVAENGVAIALVMHKPSDPDHVYRGDILDVTFADRPYDVAVGTVA